MKWGRAAVWVWVWGWCGCGCGTVWCGLGSCGVEWHTSTRGGEVEAWGSEGRRAGSVPNANGVNWWESDRRARGHWGRAAWDTRLSTATAGAKAHCRQQCTSSVRRWDPEEKGEEWEAVLRWRRGKPRGMGGVGKRNCVCGRGQCACLSNSLRGSARSVPKGLRLGPGKRA